MITGQAFKQIELPASYSFRNLVLRIVDARGPLLRAIGVDGPTLRVLLHASLTAQARGGSSEVGPTARRFLDLGISITFISFFGLLIGLYEALFVPIEGAAGVLAGSVLMANALMTLQGFSAILFERETASFVSGRPLDDRTVLVSRLLPSAVMNAMLLLAFLLPQLVAIGIRHGWLPGFALSVVIAALGSLLGFAIVLAVFVIALRCVPADRFKEILGRVQIGIALLTFVGPQLYMALQQSRDRASSGIDFGPLAKLYPPTWYSDMMAVAAGMDRPDGWVSIVVGIVVPCALTFVAIWAARGRFVAAMLAPDATTTRVRRQSPGILDRLAPRFTRSSVERAGYSLCAALQFRERVALLSILQGTLMGLVFSMQFGRDPRDAYLAGLPFLPYAFGFAVPSIATALSRSQNHDASWVVHASPVPSVQPILTGALRATMVRFCFVPSAIFSVIMGCLDGWRAGATALVAAIGAAAAGLTALRKFHYSVPFSQPVRPGEVGLSLLKAILTLSGVMLLLVVHRLVADAWVAHLVFASVMLVIAIRGWILIDRKPVLGVELDET